MIKGVHTMFCSSAPEELRTFIRDKLGFPYTDVGEGWLIFDMPEADMGCHAADGAMHRDAALVEVDEPATRLVRHPPHRRNVRRVEGQGGAACCIWVVFVLPISGKRLRQRLS